MVEAHQQSIVSNFPLISMLKLRNMYDQIAHFYHLMHRDFADDIPFLLAQTAECPDPILELGCGTGRVLLPLGRAGHRITGLDYSAAMLAIATEEIAQANLTAQILLHEANIINFDMPPQFGVCLLTYNTIMHLDNQEVQACFSNIRKALLPNGRLIIDTINPHILADVEDQQTFELEQELVDPINQRCIALSSRYRQKGGQTIELTWRFTTSAEKVDATSIYHYRYPHQLQLALQQTGFRLEQMLGDYDGSPFTEDSPRCLVLAVRG